MIPTTLDTTGKVLLPHHREHLATSGITEETARAAGLYSVTNHCEAATLLGWKIPMKSLPAIVFPYPGTAGYVRVRPDNPRRKSHRTKQSVLKYEAPFEGRQRAYFPLDVRPRLEVVAQEVLITEGEKKALVATQEGFPAIGLSGVFGWIVADNERLIPDLEAINWAGRRVFICFDSDRVSNQNVRDAESRLAKLLADRGAIVRVVTFPPGLPSESGVPSKVGLDDFIVAHAGEHNRELRRLLDEADEPAPVDPGITRLNARFADPIIEAQSFLATTVADGFFRLRYYRGDFYYWVRGRYEILSREDVVAQITKHLNHAYSRVTTSVFGNVLHQVKALANLPACLTSPCWLPETGDNGRVTPEWRLEDVMMFRNAAVHLPSLVSGTAPYMIPASPRLFTTFAADFDFDLPPSRPASWLAFLDDLWGGDEASIALLQEWLGYCLTADTRHHKMLLLVGPPRSGKGTIARVVRSIVGDSNVCGPTLSGLTGSFGLQPLLNKTLAIISDARLSGRADQQVVVERLLAITGEDAITIERKHRESVTERLTTRFVISTNELPRLADASGALSSRFLVLRTTESFVGRENTSLTERLIAERDGILAWAIEGWRRLRERGRFVEPSTSQELRHELEDLASPVSAFVRERCEVGPTHRCDRNELYLAWCKWCRENGLEPSHNGTFGRDLRAALPKLRDAQPRAGRSQRVRAYVGIRLAAG